MGDWHRGRMKCERSGKEYYEDLYNIDTQEEVAVHICGFDGIQTGNYFRGEPIGKAEVKVRLGKLKNGKTAGKDEITREMTKSGLDLEAM